MSDAFSLIWDSVENGLDILTQYNEVTNNTFFAIFIGAFCMLIIARFIFMPFLNRSPVGGMSDVVSSEIRESKSRERAYNSRKHSQWERADRERNNNLGDKRNKTYEQDKFRREYGG